jgi:uncharacterized protein YgbK (DUF1537 family)
VCARQLKDLGVGLLYRKVDSQMRGNVAADVAGALSAWGGACVFAPALPEEGRRTIGGRQCWPGGDVDLVALLRAGGLDAFAGRPDDAERGKVVVCDAEDGEDLERIAMAVARAERNLLPAGTAGLAARLPAAFGLDTLPPPRWPPCRCVLAIVGTPAAAEQARVAAAHGADVAVLGLGEEPPRVDGYDGLLLTGGETAARVLRLLGVDTLELRGEAYPRVPVGLSPHGLRIALKAGAFGPPDAIVRALEALARGG